MHIFIKCKFPPREIKASKWNTKGMWMFDHLNMYVIYAPC